MGKKSKGQGPTDYDVGHGKPPRHTRFQPGRSGNPGGRKKESLNLNTLLERVLNSEIMLSEHGKSRNVTIMEAVLLSSVKTAIAGNQRAIEYLLDRAETLDSLNQVQTADLEQEDQDLLDAAMLSRQRSLSSAGWSSRRERQDVGGPDEEIDPDDVDEDDDGSDGPNGQPPPQSGSKGREGRS